MLNVRDVYYENVLSHLMWFHINKWMLCNKNISVCLSICLDNFIKLFTLGIEQVFRCRCRHYYGDDKYIVTLINYNDNNIAHKNISILFDIRLSLFEKHRSISSQWDNCSNNNILFQIISIHFVQIPNVNTTKHMVLTLYHSDIKLKSIASIKYHIIECCQVITM